MEISLVDAFGFAAKPLISLKKIILQLRAMGNFLLQCKKVQLSGEKCLLWAFPFEKRTLQCFKGLHR
jgi:hypothetical protein